MTLVVFVILVGSTMSHLNHARADDAKHPNVLLIISDDQGWGDIRSNGNDRIDTPVLDQLASSGARFDRFFVSPLCAPTRASLLTGRYHVRSGVWGVTRSQENMRSDEVTLGELFKGAGYNTGYFGKWHNGSHYPLNPNGQGFDEFFGFCGGHWNSYFDATLERNGDPIRTTGYICDVLTDAALAFLSKNASQPFFCYVAYNTPHSPWQVPDKYFDKYKQKELDDTTACAYAMVENLDENIGRLLKALDDLRVANDTIVLFMSDNGANSERFNGDMRGRKGNVHEGGSRVPFYVRYPGHIRSGLEVKQIAAHVDVLPTLSELCRIPAPAQRPLDGRSLASLLVENSPCQNSGQSWDERELFTFGGKGERGAVRTQRWRAVKEKGVWELFDMLADPSELSDVAGEHADVVEHLSTAYDTTLKDVSSLGFDTLPISIGYAEAPIVILPGHEAFLHLIDKNGISYFGGQGWANDWISNWTSTDAYPAWEVDVVKSGTYDIGLYYSCPKADVGAKLRIEVGDASVETTVTQAFEAEPPTEAQKHDRVPRRETFDREWAMLSAGTVKLSPGRTRLVVRALERPGQHVIDLKAVRIRRAG